MHLFCLPFHVQEVAMTSTLTLHKSLHVRYIVALASHTSSLTYHLTTHLRLNAIYWALTALHLLGSPDALPREDVIEYVLECFDKREGGFGAHPGHDSHILATLSAIQILFMYDVLDKLDEVAPNDQTGKSRRDRIIAFVLSLQDKQTGEFAGDSTELEHDTRFLYCAISTLCLLSSTNKDVQTENGTETEDGIRIYEPLTRIDRKKTIDAILACYNFDGGFGRIAGSESHASQSFVSIGALRILGGVNCLGAIKRRKHERWLSERQLPNGGLNGRPQKLEDVCYSWWVLSALSMFGKLTWINGDKLARFILNCQDPDNGGISDRPDNVADVFHTLFGVAGLGMLGLPHSDGLQEIDPVYCLPVASIQRFPHLKRSYQSLIQGTNVS